MIHPHRLLRPAAWLLVAACTPTSVSEPSTRAEPEVAPGPAEAAPDKASKGALAEAPPEAPLPVIPSLAGATPVPAVEVLAPAGDCPALRVPAKGAPASQRTLVPALTVLRQVSCRLEVFGMARSEVVKALDVPEGMNFEIGRRYARVTLPQAVKVHDVLAVVGVKNARMRLEQGQRSSWFVGVGEEASELRPFGPGVLSLQIRGERNDPREHGKIEDIPRDALVDGGLVVTLPENAARFAPDPFAAPAAVAAIVTLAKDPGLLALEPKQAHARLDMLGERYTLDRYSEGLGEAAFVGLSLRPNRTELPANQLADGLGLEGAEHEQIRITDMNPNRLAYQGKTSFTWHGIELELELAKCPGGGLGLAGWCVDDIQILPTKRP